MKRDRKAEVLRGAVGCAGLSAMVACTLLAAAEVTQSLAYMTGKDEVTNVFTVGKLEIGLREPEWDPQEGDGVNMCPGYSVYKNPTVRNITPEKNGVESCYMRMRVQVLDGMGVQITEPEILKLIEKTIYYDGSYTGDWENTGEGAAIRQGRVPGYTEQELEELPMVNPLFEKDEKRSGYGNWVFNYLGKDGKGLFQIGEEAALFTDIAIPAQWTERQMERMGDFQLVISAEAIQSTGFISGDDAYAMLDCELEERDSDEKS